MIPLTTRQTRNFARFLCGQAQISPDGNEWTGCFESDPHTNQEGIRIWLSGQRVPADLSHPQILALLSERLSTHLAELTSGVEFAATAEDRSI